MDRKGVSTYISVLLLIVVVISGGILIYGYTMGWFGRLGGEGNIESLSIDSVSADAGGNVTAYIRNVGGSDVTLDAAYVDNTQAISVDQTTIAQGDVEKIVIEPSQTLAAGTTYQVKVVCTDNTQIAFSVKAE